MADDRERAFAIMYAVRKLDYYLSGAVFTIKIDHQPLKYLFKAEWKPHQKIVGVETKWVLLQNRV